MKVAPGFYVRQYALGLVARSLACCLAAILLMLLLRHVGPTWPSLPILAMSTAFLIAEYKYFREADRWADGYVGETAVARVLKPLEQEGYSVLGPRRLGHHGDIDQVVVGPTGLFAIEIKAWNGRIEWRGDELFVNGRARTRKVRKVSGHAMELRRRVPEGLELGWVEAVTVFAKAFPSVGCRHKKSYWTVPSEDLVGFIRSRRARLTEEECAWIAASLH